MRPGQALGEVGMHPRHCACAPNIAKKLFSRTHALIRQGTANTSVEHFMDTFFMAQFLRAEERLGFGCHS